MEASAARQERAAVAMEPNMERLELFRDDLKKLRDWNHAHILSKVDLRDASVVIFRVVV